tara:strand:+ start:357 stop:2063 length:1707 start_codon:yes stop_codon:yes gene_type:complete
VDTISKEIKMINKIKNLIKNNNLDGYILPKNDKYFTEYSKLNNLQLASNFSGSAGFAVILKKKNYLFVDGRYTIQAKKESGNKFKIFEIPYKWPKDIFKDLKIGFDPKLFTQNILYRYFENKCNLIAINQKLFDKNSKLKKDKPFYTLKDEVSGERSNLKINRAIKYLKKKKLNYLYISAGENICWLLNIRGNDLPNSPVANCKLILTEKRKIYFFSPNFKVSNIKSKFKKIKIDFFKESDFFEVLTSLNFGKFCIDNQTCSIFDEELIKSKFKIDHRIDPIYYFKSIKNKTEIENMKKAHIDDGVALSKFLYWIKNTNIKKITEKKVESKLESFRKLNKNYLFPSFDTIAGSGPNGAIIHYRSDENSNRKLKNNDLLLVDSGGQYRWGTTDVTRTICFSKPSNKIKNIFTRVLKGHIAVAISNIIKEKTGHNIDKRARKSLNSVGLDYRHGTGHGVGYFLNVHEGPQSLSKNNKVELKEGMIVSNEPGFYLEKSFGIRIENLVFIKKISKKLKFENLTLAPIDKHLINFKMLNKTEKDYLFSYHLNVYEKISKYLNKKEKKWLINFL